MRQKLLLIRFSSFGDIIQAIGVPQAFRNHFGAESTVDWLTRLDMKGLVEGQPDIDCVYAFRREEGVVGLLRLAWQLAAAGNYTHLYDAHRNLRSLLFCLIFRLRRPRINYVYRPKSRLRRWLYFRFRLPVLPHPFRGADSFHAPLKRWGLPPRVADRAQLAATADCPSAVAHDLEALGGPLIALAPSAAWEMKRWPVEHWRALIRLLPDAKFALLGGPADRFLEELRLEAPARVVNLAGRLNLEENAAVFERAKVIIANDTGLLHIADQMARPTLALIGPTAFGYPSHSTSETLETDLWCKPCSKDGRGGCVNDLYKRCLVEVAPERVAAAVVRRLGELPK